jgi:hypothetical protein
MPRMYAPLSWDQGSSYSHLDENTYPNGDPNSLMTPGINNGEAVHDPGPIARGMFTDMGWTTSASQVAPTATPTLTPTLTPIAELSPTATPTVGPPTPVPAGGARVLIPITTANARTSN